MLCRVLLLVLVVVSVEFDDDMETLGISEELPVSEANKSFGVGVRFFGNGMVELLSVVVVGVVVHVEEAQVASNVRTLMPAFREREREREREKERE